MLTAIHVATTIYVVINTATAAVRPWPRILSEDWATGAAVHDVLGNIGLFFVGTAMTCAVLSGMNALLLSASRLIFSMSRVGALLAWFGKVDNKNGVPKNALILLAVFALVAPFLGREVINIGLLGLIFSVFFLCLLLLPFMPGFLSVPSLWALIVWTVIGIAMYFSNRKRFNSNEELQRMIGESLEEIKL